jgi:hypothetical protein
MTKLRVRIETWKFYHAGWNFTPGDIEMRWFQWLVCGPKAGFQSNFKKPLLSLNFAADKII